MGSVETVPRPAKKTPYLLYFTTARAKKGWRDVVAVRRNDAVKAWDFLAHTPTEVTLLSYPLRGDLARVTWQGHTYERWQLKFSATEGIRVWYFVDGANVFIEAVHTGHPHQTK